jgi:hypothetical protein
LPTTTFSRTYNLSRLHDILAIVKECLARLEISEATMLSRNKCIVLEATREGLPIKITLREYVIGGEMLEIFRGEPKMKVDEVINSGNNGSVARLAQEFEDCSFNIVVRGRG